jgi:hypothetical protein
VDSPPRTRWTARGLITSVRILSWARGFCEKPMEMIIGSSGHWAIGPSGHRVIGSLIYLVIVRLKTEGIAVNDTITPWPDHSMTR